MKNWYKISKASLSVEEIASQVRNSLLRDDEETLAALCLPVSRHLAQILINNGYKAASVVQGTFTVDNPDPSAYDEWDIKDFGSGEETEEDYEEMEAAKYTPLHYWVQLNNIVVDITADQFNDELDEPMPEVVTGDINALERYTVITDNFIDPRIMYR